MGTWYVLPDDETMDEIELMRSGLGDWGHKFIDKVRTASGKWRYIYEDTKDKLGNIGNNIRQRIIHKRAMDRIDANRGTNRATSNAQYRAAKATADRIRQERVEAGNRRRAARISSQLRASRHNSDTGIDPRNPSKKLAYSSLGKSLRQSVGKTNKTTNVNVEKFNKEMQSGQDLIKNSARHAYKRTKSNIEYNREKNKRDRATGRVNRMNDYYDNLNALNNSSGDAFAAKPGGYYANKDNAISKAFRPTNAKSIKRRPKPLKINISKRKNSPAKGHKARKTWMGTKA